jgi:hypothetical protein
MTFLRSADQCSLGSRWFWSLQKDKMYTLGPTESPSGQWGHKGSQKGQKKAPKTLLGPFRPILVYFLGPGPEFFQVLLGQNRPKISFQFFLHYFDSRRVWDPQKPKFDSLDPPGGPHFGPICGQKGRFWGQRTQFLAGSCVKGTVY